MACCTSPLSCVIINSSVLCARIMRSAIHIALNTFVYLSHMPPYVRCIFYIARPPTHVVAVRARCRCSLFSHLYRPINPSIKGPHNATQGLCARVRACAGAAESLHTYIRARRSRIPAQPRAKVCADVVISAHTMLLWLWSA